MLSAESIICIIIWCLNFSVFILLNREINLYVEPGDQFILVCLNQAILLLILYVEPGDQFFKIFFFKAIFFCLILHWKVNSILKRVRCQYATTFNKFWFSAKEKRISLIWLVIIYSLPIIMWLLILSYSLW